MVDDDIKGLGHQWPNIKLTHLGRVAHIGVGNFTIIGSDNGLWSDQRLAKPSSNAGMILIGHIGTKFSEFSHRNSNILIKKMRLTVSSAKWRSVCLDLIVLILTDLTRDIPVSYFVVKSMRFVVSMGDLMYHRITWLFNVSFLSKIWFWISYMQKSIHFPIPYAVKWRHLLLTVDISNSLQSTSRVSVSSLIARFMGPTWAHLGSTGPRWAPCWPHEPCY